MVVLYAQCQIVNLPRNDSARVATVLQPVGAVREDCPDRPHVRFVRQRNLGNSRRAHPVSAEVLAPREREHGRRVFVRPVHHGLLPLLRPVHPCKNRVAVFAEREAVNPSRRIRRELDPLLRKKGPLVVCEVAVVVEVKQQSFRRNLLRKDGLDGGVVDDLNDALWMGILPAFQDRHERLHTLMPERKPPRAPTAELSQNALGRVRTPRPEDSLLRTLPRAYALICAVGGGHKKAPAIAGRGGSKSTRR